MDHPTDPNEQRPEGLPDKFASVESMATAYAELEQRLGQGGIPPKEGVQELTPPTPEPATETQALTPNPEDSLTVPSEPTPLDFSDYEKEFSETGQLAEESYGKLQALGVNKEMVDQYIAGQIARGNAHVAEIHNHAGGQEQYAQLMQWAAKNLSAGEIAAYDQQVRGHDTEVAKMAVAGVKARFEAAAGIAPTLLQGTQAPPVSKGYESTAQMQAAMNDPKYESDPAYRAEVARRLESTQL